MEKGKCFQLKKLLLFVIKNEQVLFKNSFIYFRNKINYLGNVYSSTGGTSLKKFVCWKLNARGAVGETLLHVCFLSGLPAHMKLLALRLIQIFPKTINDVYICDEYYGKVSVTKNYE